MNYERFFLEEVQEKKKGLSGVRGRTGKMGYTGKVMTPVDFMTRKEKYNYRKGGKVMTYNLYDNILPKDEFFNLSDEEQKTALLKWREDYRMKDIQKALQVSGQTIYNRMDELGIEKNGKGKSKVKKKTPPNINNNVTVVNQSTPQTTDKPQQETIERNKGLNTFLTNSVLEGLLKEHEVKGLNLNYTSRLTADEIQQKLEKLALSIDGEKSKFILDIKILET